jgi:Winged helix-turn helix
MDGADRRGDRPVAERALSCMEAAEVLGMSERHFRRLRNRYEAEGAEGLIDRSCIGILGLVKRFGAERVDAACARALALGTRSYSSVAAILKNRRERAADAAEAPILLHENVRGPDYYH